MANTKKIIHPWNVKGIDVYCVIRREATGYLLDNDNGDFAAAPVDPILPLTENAAIGGLYELTESRSEWDDGQYTIIIYRQEGALPDIVGDTIIGAGVMQILDDAEGTPPLIAVAIRREIDANSTRLAAIVKDTAQNLPAAIAGVAQGVWDVLTSALTTVGSIGARIMLWLGSEPEGATAFGANELVLCNNALALLGHDLLATMDGKDKATTLLAQFYQQTVDAVLRAYPWNCALTRSPALTAAPTAASFGYGYKYTLPGDCLRMLKMQNDNYRFKIEGADIDSSAGYLLTDVAEAYVLYIKRIAAAYMDSLLKDAISARLAAAIAFPLTNSNTVAKLMWDLYEAKLDEARTVDAFEGTSERLQLDDDADWNFKRL